MVGSSGPDPAGLADKILRVPLVACPPAAPEHRTSRSIVKLRRTRYAFGSRWIAGWWSGEPPNDRLVPSPLAGEGQGGGAVELPLADRLVSAASPPTPALPREGGGSKRDQNSTTPQSIMSHAFINASESIGTGALSFPQGRAPPTMRNICPGEEIGMVGGAHPAGNMDRRGSHFKQVHIGSKRVRWGWPGQRVVRAAQPQEAGGVKVTTAATPRPLVASRPGQHVVRATRRDSRPG